jgi:hypothetical protein
VNDESRPEAASEPTATKPTAAAMVTPARRVLEYDEGPPKRADATYDKTDQLTRKDGHAKRTP